MEAFVEYLLTELVFAFLDTLDECTHVTVQMKLREVHF